MNICYGRATKLRCYYFTARRYARAVYTVVVCLSVHLSVSPSQDDTVPKWLDAGSREQLYTTAQGLQLFDAKGLGEIPMGSPQQERQIEVGYVQIGDVRPTSRYISETVEDRNIVTMEH